ncbi:MAG: hypothetical protein ND895_24170 [Pyrinomonadaceae bacterium]|nr:hypothetical protein [Pyrinomonadaceae bacterium]
MSEFGRNFDCSALSYDQWIRFFFDRPESPQSDDLVNYRFDFDLREEYTFFDAQDPAKVVSHMTTLFGDFPKALSAFTLPQINQGVWVIFGSIFECQRYLFDPSVPLEKCLGCIRSMYGVYADFVALSDVEVMENCFSMWWHWIADSFWSQFYDYPNGSKSFDETLEQYPLKKDLNKLDEKGWQILETMFETLVRILALDDQRSQEYALHGLGHLYHPKVKEVVQSYIDAHVTEFDDEDLKWVQQCRDGIVL